MQNIGIDFGTTNTVAAFTQPDGSVRTASFRTGEVFRSVLCFWLEQEKPASICGTQPDRMGFCRRISR